MTKALSICLLLGLVSCTHGSSLRARSAGDLHCSADALKIYRLDDRSYRVLGCGHEVVYVSTCDGARNCTWVMNENVTEASTPTKPTASALTPGCSFDAQCKGDRICVARQCVAPQPPPPQQ